MSPPDTFVVTCPECGMEVLGQVTQWRLGQVAAWRCPECNTTHARAVDLP